MMTNRQYRNLEPAGFLLICFALLAVSTNRFESSYQVTKAGEAHEEGIYVQIGGEITFKGTYFFDHPPALEELFPEDITFSPTLRPIVSHSLIEIIKNDEGWSVSRKEIPAYQKLTLGIPISLNQETEEGLTAIPGIGPQTAKTLVMEREKRGGFKSVDEIKSVKGIGEGTFQKINPYLTL